jgi:hypothetical protein
MRKPESKRFVIARGLGVAPPREPMEKAQRELREAAALVGREFDREFLRYTIDDHREDIRDFREQAAAGHHEVAGWRRTASDSGKTPANSGAPDAIPGEWPPSRIAPFSAVSQGVFRVVDSRSFQDMARGSVVATAALRHV